MKIGCCFFSTSELASNQTNCATNSTFTHLAPHAPINESRVLSSTILVLPLVFALVCALRSSSARSRNALFVLIIFSRFFSLQYATGGLEPATMRSTTPCLRTSLAANGTASRSSEEKLRRMRAALMVGMIKAGTNAIVGKTECFDRVAGLQLSQSLAKMA